MTGHSCRNLCHEDLSCFYSDSKTGLKLRCDYYVNFQLLECTQDIFIRLTAVCCMLLPHNPYRVPQHYKMHVCGPSCSCKHRFLWISLIFGHQFSRNCMGTVHHWKPFWSIISVCFIGQCWYFNPQWTPVQAINKTGCVWFLLAERNTQLLCVDI